MNQQAAPDITRNTLMVLIIGILIVSSLWTLLPFIGALVWATALVVATWPLLLWVQRKAGGRRSVAAIIMTLIIAVVFIVPFCIAVGALIDGSAHGIEVARSYLKNGLGAPPSWLTGIPWAGERLTGKWSELAALSPEALGEAMRPYARSIAAWVAAVSGGIGGLLIHVLLTLVLTGVLYAQGETAAAGVVAFARRLGRERGANVVILAGQSIRSVALGVVVTALAQSILAGLGLWVAGVPHAGLLTAAIFILCIAQLGPFPVLVPVLIWAFSHMSMGWAVALLVWSIPVGIMDNFLRPILISRGVDLPLLLIFAGVIGGLIGFGIIGLFVGPVILAVTYTLLQGWVRDDAASRAPAAQV